ERIQISEDAVKQSPEDIGSENRFAVACMRPQKVRRLRPVVVVMRKAHRAGQRADKRSNAAMMDRDSRAPEPGTVVSTVERKAVAFLQFGNMALSREARGLGGAALDQFRTEFVVAGKRIDSPSDIIDVQGVDVKHGVATDLG